VGSESMTRWSGLVRPLGIMVFGQNCLGSQLQCRPASAIRAQQTLFLLHVIVMFGQSCLVNQLQHRANRF
jgi:hypothetical protein